MTNIYQYGYALYTAMISICAAEVMTALEDDGSHRFIFTDGIYRFDLHLDMARKGHPRGIEVRNVPGISRHNS